MELNKILTIYIHSPENNHHSIFKGQGMKKALFFAIITTLTFAEGKFEEKKSGILENLDKRISYLQKAKTCASSASNMEALKTCRKSLKESMKTMRSMRKSRK